MKKIVLALILATLATTGAFAQKRFFYGGQFGIFTDGNSTTFSDGSPREKGATSFNFTIKPSIGYYFTPKLVGGLKFTYTNCSFAEQETGQTVFNIRSIAMNVLMGNGIEKDYESWRISPYLRYELFSLANDKLKLWLELSGYAGVRTPRDSNHKLDPTRRKIIYGAELHPLVSYAITKKLMIFTSIDFPSIAWEGSARTSPVGESDTSTRYEGAFFFQANPLVAVGTSLFNLGIMRRF